MNSTFPHPFKTFGVIGGISWLSVFYAPPYITPYTVFSYALWVPLVS
ncbi:hypothetical protein GYH30_049429 [Glycine max]|nr:hypothetical protein GYH30_049429 [Glycine max]